MSRGRLLDRSSPSAQQINHQNYQSQHQQNVDESAQRVGTHQSQ